MVHRRDEAIRRWRNWLREDPLVHPYKWLRPDLVPPAPFLQCQPHLTPGGSGMSTAPQSLIGRASTPKRRPKKAGKIRQKNPRHHHRSQSREARENRPVVQVRTARSKTATRSVNWALFSIQTEWRGNAIRNRFCRNVENVCNSSKRPVLMQNMYPLSNQEKRPRVAEESPEKSNAEIVYQLPRANHEDCNQEQTSESLRRLT